MVPRHRWYIFVLPILAARHHCGFGTCVIIWSFRWPTVMVQVVGIIPCERQGYVYPAWLTQSLLIPWPHWRLKEQGHQQCSIIKCTVIFLRKKNSECIFFNNVLKCILFSEVPYALGKIWMSFKKRYNALWFDVISHPNPPSFVIYYQHKCFIMAWTPHGIKNVFRHYLETPLQYFEV